VLEFSTGIGNPWWATLRACAHWGMSIHFRPVVTRWALQCTTRLAMGVGLACVVTLTPSPPALAQAEAAAADTPGTALAREHSWIWPLAGTPRVVAGYEPPLSPFAEGHRGIDLAAAEQEVVLAPADGVVRFAGYVVNRGVLSIDHGGVVSSFEAVGALVQAGDRVSQGQPVAVVGTGSHCACLHVGARIRGLYVSPLALIGRIPAAVLVPWSDQP
jgi:murein DD-endopeptidase MepM/ murein hydrolase activator NlpD